MSTDPPTRRFPRRKGEARRVELLKILARMRDEGHAPTYVDLGRELGITPSTAAYHVRWLRDNHIIELGPARLNIRILRESIDEATP